MAAQANNIPLDGSIQGNDLVFPVAQTQLGRGLDCVDAVLGFHPLDQGFFARIGGVQHGVIAGLVHSSAASVVTPAVWM